MSVPCSDRHIESPPERVKLMRSAKEEEILKEIRLLIESLAETIKNTDIKLVELEMQVQNLEKTSLDKVTHIATHETTVKSSKGSATHAPPVLNSSTDAPTHLTTEQLNEVIKELPCFAKWKKLGLNLGLPIERLDVIKEDFKDADERLGEVLKHWLMLNFNYNKYGLPTWNSLAKAVNPINHALAKTITAKHIKQE